MFMHAEWTRIEPEQGKIDEKAIARYHAILDCLLRCLFWLAAQLPEGGLCPLGQPQGCQ